MKEVINVMRFKPLFIIIASFLMTASLIACSYNQATTNRVAELSDTLVSEETSDITSNTAESSTTSYTDSVATVGKVKSANELNFPDCVNFALPDNLTAGDFDQYLGMGGGIPLYNDEGELCGCFELHLFGSSIFEDGELIGVAQFANHAWFEGDFISINSSLPCIAVKYSKDVFDDKTSQYIGEQILWYAFWAKEGYTPQYALYLVADAYEFEDLEAIANSVIFSDEAFVVR